MPQFLTSYYPLCCTKKGRNAAAQYGLSPFIDGSCRREPDFEDPMPAITGLCRPGFLKRVKEGSQVIYMTNKKGLGANHFVTILEVVKLTDDHEEAARWYMHHNYPIPNNLMVSETNPFPLDQTHQLHGRNMWAPWETLDKWNEHYVQRVKSSSSVAICRFEEGPFLETPNIIPPEELMYIFRRRICTRTPPELKPVEWERFQECLLSPALF